MWITQECMLFRANLKATAHKIAVVQPPISQVIIVRWTRQAGNCWWIKNEHIRDVLVWTITHGHTSVGRPFGLRWHRMECRGPTWSDWWDRDGGRDRGSGDFVLSAWLSSDDDDDDDFIILSNNLYYYHCFYKNCHIFTGSATRKLSYYFLFTGSKLSNNNPIHFCNGGFGYSCYRNKYAASVQD